MTNKDLFSGLEDMLFYTITDGAEKVPVSHFIAVSFFYFIYIYTHNHIHQSFNYILKSLH